MENPAQPIAYKRAPRPLVFPTVLAVGESRRHLELRTLLYLIFKQAFASRAAVGSDQFVYFRANDPRRCVSPDVFVKLGAPSENFRSWKTWERGTPDVAIEVVSEHEPIWPKLGRSTEALSGKLAEYHELGVRELVVFDPEAEEGARVRIWDRVDDDLVERVVHGDTGPSLVLGGAWCVAPSSVDPVSLRLVDDAGNLLLTEAEAAQAKVRELEARLAELTAK